MSTRLRVAAFACWLGIALLLARIASGGGPFGILYVVGVESVFTLALGAVCLVIAIWFAVAFARPIPMAIVRRSRVAALAVVPFGLYLATIDHPSGLAIAVMAAAAAVIAGVGAQRTGRGMP